MDLVDGAGDCSPSRLRRRIETVSPRRTKPDACFAARTLRLRRDQFHDFGTRSPLVDPRSKLRSIRLATNPSKGGANGVIFSNRSWSPSRFGSLTATLGGGLGDAVLRGGPSVDEFQGAFGHREFGGGFECFGFGAAFVSSLGNRERPFFKQTFERRNFGACVILGARRLERSLPASWIFGGFREPFFNSAPVRLEVTSRNSAPQAAIR